VNHATDIDPTSCGCLRSDGCGGPSSSVEINLCAIVVLRPLSMFKWVCVIFLTIKQLL
jgi:hypothetical protein